jgi:DNA-binding transcriptional MerR regulator
MAWSTRGIAELTGTTVKAVRHYHSIGLLELPDRATNGYKQYEVRHVVRLLEITRFTDLGVPLSQIAAIGQADVEPERVLHHIDVELAANIEHLEKTRAELDLIFRHESSPDLPKGFLPISPELSAADRSLILIYSRVYGPAEMEDVREFIVELSTHPAHILFGSLGADAGEDIRQSVVEQYAPVLQAMTGRYSWMLNPGSRAARGAAFAESTVGQAFRDLYNAAQLDVLQRATRIVRAGSSSHV